MAQAKGARVRIVADFEQSYGVPPVTAGGTAIKFNAESLSATQSQDAPKTITGSRNPVEPILGNIEVGGSLTLPAELYSLGVIFKALLGQPTTTSFGSLFSHVFKVADTVPSMIIEKGFTDIGKYFLYHGCKVSKFEIEVGGEKELTYSAAIMGAKRDINPAPYNSSPEVMPFVRLQNFRAEIWENGSKLANISGMKLSLDAGLDGDSFAVGGGGFRGELSEGIINISGSLTAFFTDTILHEKAISSAKSSIKLRLGTPDETMYVEILLPEIKFAQKDPEVSGPKGILAELEFGGFYDSAPENSSVVVTIVNEKESY